MARRALISVSDKTGIVELARGLTQLGFEVLSTGGTMSALSKADVGVTSVSDITGFPECLDGRVKTLHPAIHGGLLAMRANAEHMKQIAELGIQPIDVVVINLYPFRQTIEKPGVTFEEAIENIDIGGPTMLRAAAKNWQDVAVVIDPADYETVLEELKDKGEVSRETKLRLCYKVFAHTAQYDAMIAGYLKDKTPGVPEYPETLTLTYDLVQTMRYGENPHQSAAFYRELGPRPGCLTDAEQLWGKELSYNNIGDTNGALDLLREFEETAVVAVKHANPCGVGVGATVLEAYRLAYEADPMSIFGGIVATNAVIDADTAREMVESREKVKIFLEIIVAPGFTDEALEILKKKKNIRLLKLNTTHRAYPEGVLEMKKVAGGMLVQQINDKLLPDEPWTVATDRAPSAQETRDLIMAWKIVKHTKSNAIAIAKDNQSLGIGPGQVNRIWATKAALERSGEKAKGAAMASDAYFPFDDCVRAAAAAGITAVIHPGGSKNDADSIKVANEHGIAIVLTGMRHFKH